MKIFYVAIWRLTINVLSLYNAYSNCTSHYNLIVETKKNINRVCRSNEKHNTKVI